jgi:hypothetical protein
MAWRQHKQQLFSINIDIIDAAFYFFILVTAQMFKHPYLGVLLVVVLGLWDLVVSYREGKKLLEGE